MALRHQLSVLQRTARRPRLKACDRVFWVWLSRIWPQWRSALLIVRPETVIKWHRQGFRLYWRWKSRAGKPGRPRVDPDIRELIRRMSRENPLWGAPRIVHELALLGVHVAKSTVEQYMIRNGKPPSAGARRPASRPNEVGRRPPPAHEALREDCRRPGRAPSPSPRHGVVAATAHDAAKWAAQWQQTCSVIRVSTS